MYMYTYIVKMTLILNLCLTSLQMIMTVVKKISGHDIFFLKKKNGTEVFKP